jgi:hypothetical protein
MIKQKGDTSKEEATEQHYIMEKYMDSQWTKDADGEWKFQFKVKWDGYEDLTWEDHTTLDKDVAKTDHCYLRPGDDDFNMEQEFYNRHPGAPHHDNLVTDRVDALVGRRTLHRHKGKPPVRCHRK